MNKLREGEGKSLFLETNIFGVPVEIYKIETDMGIWFCAYADIKNAHLLNDETLGGDCTWVEKDEVGVDTAHTWMRGKGQSDLLRLAITQITDLIGRVKKVLRDEAD